VLLPAVANDPDHLARFSREAQVLASLNHPNIARIYGVEEPNGVTALVLDPGPPSDDRKLHKSKAPGLAPLTAATTQATCGSSAGHY